MATASTTSFPANRDFAFLRLEGNRYLCGVGPFRTAAAAPSAEGGAAFYLNDFALADPEPWKIPAHFFETHDLRRLLPDNGSTPLPAIEWDGLKDAEFRSAYDEILCSITEGRLEKSVPVITERGRINGGDPAALINAVGAAPSDLWGYGFRFGESGSVGLTPERLFSFSGGYLETMALAGTAPRHEAGQFLTDPKEIREHEFVATYLVEKLAELGEIKREMRVMLDLGSIVHFLSRIQVKLREPVPGIDDLIRHMHPTPALGAYPRGDGALRDLMSVRRRLGAPEHFGAPFGAFHQGDFHSVVAIRNVSWSGNDVFLPSGCGIIRESRFDREWRELALKRNAVKSLLGI